MFTAIDHATVVVPDLDEAIGSFRRLGFVVSDGSVDVDGAGESAFIRFDDIFVELTTRARPSLGSGADASTSERASRLHGLALRTDDIDAAAMRTRGVRVGEISERRLRTSSGDELRCREAVVEHDGPLPLTLVEHVTSWPLTAVGGTDGHPNTASRLERAYVAVPDVREAAQEYERVLGIPTPELERGTVIMSMMAVFSVGSMGIALSEPFGEGVTAEALEGWGPGPFQLLFHAESIDAAAAYMQQQGLPEPARGVRLSGEHAVLMLPEYACGTYIALAGPR